MSNLITNYLLPIENGLTALKSEKAPAWGGLPFVRFTFCRRGRAAVSAAYAVRSGKTEQVKSGVHIDAGMRIPYY